MKIIDLSAGNRAMWFDKHNPVATFVDIRPEVSPTIVCSSCELPVEFTNQFDLAVFDPPHTNFGPNSDMSKTYGHLTGIQITDLIGGTAKEAHRVVKDGGFLVLKWNDRDRKLESVLSLMSDYWTPLFGQIVATRRRHAKTDRLSATWWVIMIKTPVGHVDE